MCVHRCACAQVWYKCDKRVSEEGGMRVGQEDGVRVGQEGGVRVGQEGGFPMSVPWVSNRTGPGWGGGGRREGKEHPGRAMFYSKEHILYANTFYMQTHSI